MIKKISGFAKKVLSGQSPVKIKYNESEWDNQFRKGNWDFLHKEHENIVLVSNLLEVAARGKSQKLRVLDIGCGNGALASRLDSNLIEYYGADISIAAVEEARMKVPWGIFVQSNMDSDVPFSGEQFDVVLFCEVLVYVDYEKILQRYESKLLPDGVFIISLYDVWRTKVIWRRIMPSITCVANIYVKNKLRNIGWTVVMGKYKK